MQQQLDLKLRDLAFLRSTKGDVRPEWPKNNTQSWAVSFKKQQIFYAFKVAKLIKQPPCWCPSFSPLELACWYYATNLRKFVHYYSAHMSENPTAPELWTKNPEEARMRWVGIGCFLQFSVLKN